ncbi:GNAT family N-acetyltransferase [Streptomyces sp. x-80]|uniref:GNAT family N-acetyltransferase n=1 Tax=Streptomyces sp. x-80 TaxID=2789282 RepID=UPI003980E87E
MEHPVITLRHYAHENLAQIRQLLLDVHTDIPEYSPDDPFVRRFPWFVDHWGGRPDFTCVIAYDADEPVGFAYGSPLSEGTEWWRDHITPAPEYWQTYAVSELMVRPKWRKTGVSSQLHEALVAERSEDLAVLLVDSSHPKVQSLYESWGYEKVGNRQPFADSPVYATMVRCLRRPAVMS